VTTPVQVPKGGTVQGWKKLGLKKVFRFFRFWVFLVLFRFSRYRYVCLLTRHNSRSNVLL